MKQDLDHWTYRCLIMNIVSKLWKYIFLKMCLNWFSLFFQVQIQALAKKQPLIWLNEEPELSFAVETWLEQKQVIFVVKKRIYKVVEMTIDFYLIYFLFFSCQRHQKRFWKRFGRSCSVGFGLFEICQKMCWKLAWKGRQNWLFNQQCW